MKRTELEQAIEEIITEILSEGTKTFIATSGNDEEQSIQQDNTIKNKQSVIKTLKGSAPGTAVVAVTTNEAEEALTEMASFYKVKDKAGFKSALAKYKEAKGDKFDKGALGKLLSTLDKDGEVDLKALSKETGKDIATYNNPQTRGSLEKEGGEFTDYLEAGKGEKAPKEKAEDKPKAEPKKAEKKVEPKKEKPAPKKEEPKKAEKAEDEDEDSTDEKAPSEAELKKIDKEFSSTPEEKKEKFNLGLKFIKKYKDDKPKIDAYLKKAKEEYKLPKNMMDDLKLAAGRAVE